MTIQIHCEVYDIKTRWEINVCPKQDSQFNKHEYRAGVAEFTTVIQ